MSIGEPFATALAGRIIPQETPTDLNQLDDTGLRVEIENQLSRQAGLAEAKGFFSGWTLPAVLAGSVFGFFVYKYLSK